MNEIIERLKKCAKGRNPILITPEQAHLILVAIKEFDDKYNIYKG